MRRLTAKQKYVSQCVFLGLGQVVALHKEAAHRRNNGDETASVSRLCRTAVANYLVLLDEERGTK